MIRIPEDVLPEFLARVPRAACDRFIIHARKAWLQGLSPKENRDIPPLDYVWSMQMKELFPRCICRSMAASPRWSRHRVFWTRALTA